MKIQKTSNGYTVSVPALKSVAPVTAPTQNQAVNLARKAIDDAVKSQKN